MATTNNSTIDLPTPDEVKVATEILALGVGELDGIRMALAHAVNPNDPPAISLEQVGCLWLYARDCEMQADTIQENVSGLLSDLEQLYYGSESEDSAQVDRTYGFVEAWHRESLKDPRA